jgi:hypothetical protein
MKLTRAAAALTLAVGLAVSGAATANAEPGHTPAPQLCDETNNFDGYLGSKGGCVSSLSSIGLDALMAGAFPSRAAAVANCKGIADLYGGYPYYFYGRVGDDRYMATNIKTCVDILYLFHTGQLEPGPAA